jgi:hypothetical protein
MANETTFYNKDLSYFSINLYNSDENINIFGLNIFADARLVPLHRRHRRRYIYTNSTYNDSYRKPVPILDSVVLFIIFIIFITFLFVIRN